MMFWLNQLMVIPELKLNFTEKPFTHTHVCVYNLSFTVQLVLSVCVGCVRILVEYECVCQHSGVISVSYLILPEEAG